MSAVLNYLLKNRTKTPEELKIIRLKNDVKKLSMVIRQKEMVQDSMSTIIREKNEKILELEKRSGSSTVEFNGNRITVINQLKDWNFDENTNTLEITMDTKTLISKGNFDKYGNC